MTNKAWIGVFAVFVLALWFLRAQRGSNATFANVPLNAQSPTENKQAIAEPQEPTEKSPYNYGILKLPILPSEPIWELAYARNPDDMTQVRIKWSGKRAIIERTVSNVEGGIGGYKVSLSGYERICANCSVGIPYEHPAMKHIVKGVSLTYTADSCSLDGDKRYGITVFYSGEVLAVHDRIEGWTGGNELWKLPEN
jgi:hypothetical protein